MTEQTKDFIIKDKRLFAEKDEDQKEQEERKEPSKEEVDEQKSRETSESVETKAEAQLPEINFATFIFSLNSSVFVHLGLIEDPATGKKDKNLSLAKQTIDILGMLEEKTSGNLSKEEENMLKNILYDLRILYVKEKG
jgi:hypothetical protein